MEKKTKRIILTVLEVLFLALFVFALINIVNIYNSYRQGDEIYEEAKDKYFDESSFKIDLEGIKKVNPEIVGWVLIEDSKVSYPLLQTMDNNKYLKLTYDLKQSNFGSIFIDFNNNADMSDQHTIIYGHNTRNGSMFGSLKSYRDADYFKSHPYIYV
ncbi:MAG: sortase, partial [Oscillospiraceae bacterium]|nr:sortase [Oscillospiraceae bacterium]